MSTPSLARGLRHRDLAFSLHHLVSVTQDVALQTILREVACSFPFYRTTELNVIDLLLKREPRVSPPALTALVHALAGTPLCTLPELHAYAWDQATLQVATCDPPLMQMIVRLSADQKDRPLIPNSKLEPDNEQDPPALRYRLRLAMEQLVRKQPAVFGQCLSLIDTARAFMWVGRARHGSSDPILAVWDALLNVQQRPIVKQLLTFWLRMYLSFAHELHTQKCVMIQGLLTAFYAEQLEAPRKLGPLVSPRFRCAAKAPKLVPLPEFDEDAKPYTHQPTIDVCDRARHILTDPLALLARAADSRKQPSEPARRCALALQVGHGATEPFMTALPLHLPHGWMPFKTKSQGLIIACELSNSAQDGIRKLQLMDVMRTTLGLPRVYAYSSASFWCVPLDRPDQYGTALLGKVDDGRVTGPVPDMFIHIDARLEYLQNCCFRALMGCGRTNEPSRLLLPMFTMLEDPAALIFHALVEDFTLGRRAFSPELAAQLVLDIASGGFADTFETLETFGSWSPDQLMKLFESNGVPAAPEVVRQILVRSRLISVLTVNALKSWGKVV